MYAAEGGADPDPESPSSTGAAPVETAEAIVARHLSQLAPLRAESAAFAAEYEGAVAAVASANDAFVAMHIRASQLSLARAAYFKRLTEAAAAYSTLHAAATALVGSLTAACERLEALQEEARARAGAVDAG